MSFRSRLTFIALWVLSILVVGVLVSAQTRREAIPPDSGVPAAVISGPDLGFRPDGWRGHARTGRFVVRINGEWVDAVDSVRMIPLAK